MKITENHFTVLIQEINHFYGTDNWKETLIHSYKQITERKMTRVKIF
jgi:hypothetical protein